jgi:hypothetical protein
MASTARSAADALTAAQAVLASKAKAVEATLDGVSVMLDLRGQGDRIDDIDVKSWAKLSMRTQLRSPTRWPACGTMSMSCRRGWLQP